MQMRALVFGGETGWIGQKIVTLLQDDPRFNNVCPTQIRMENRESVRALIDEVKPDRVFIAAGVTGRPNVDWCESNRQATVRANVLGTLNVIDLCSERGIHVTYYATGCIYEGGYDGIGFNEDSPPNFEKSFYSLSKSLCERVIRETYENVLTLRLRMPISDDLHPRSFITKITNYAKVVDVPNSMSVLHDLLPISTDMSVRALTGVYNFCNPGLISHNEILQMYKEEVDSNFVWQNFTIEEQALILKAGRSNNKLDVKKLTIEYPSLPEIHVAVRAALRRIRVQYLISGVRHNTSSSNAELVIRVCQ